MTANKDMTVTISLVGVEFSVYFTINGGSDRKVVHGLIYVIDILRNDVIDVKAVGSGDIVVTTT